MAGSPRAHLDNDPVEELHPLVVFEEAFLPETLVFDAPKRTQPLGRKQVCNIRLSGQHTQDTTLSSATDGPRLRLPHVSS